MCVDLGLFSQLSWLTKSMGVLGPFPHLPGWSLVRRGLARSFRSESALSASVKDITETDSKAAPEGVWRP